MLANSHIDDDPPHMITAAAAANGASGAVDEEPAQPSSSSVASSDDTVFLDLPLPPVPRTDHAVRIQNVDTEPATRYGVLFGGVERLYSRMDDFDDGDDVRRLRAVAPRQSPERCSSSVSLAGSDRSNRSSSHSPTRSRSCCSEYSDETTPQLDRSMARSSSRWSTSDEDASFYRERMSQFRSSESTERSGAVETTRVSKDAAASHHHRSNG